MLEANDRGATGVPLARTASASMAARLGAANVTKMRGVEALDKEETSGSPVRSLEALDYKGFDRKKARRLLAQRGLER